MALFDFEPIWDGSTSNGSCGSPHVESSGRLWALWHGGGRTHPTVEFSDDYGQTWTLWATVAPTADCIPKSGSTVLRDTQGNIYFNAFRSNSHPRTCGIARVDATTKAMTRAFDFYVLPGYEWQPSSEWWQVDMLAWNKTLGLDGSIYISQYGNVYYNEAGQIVDGGLDGYQAQYIWKGNASGTSWQRVDIFTDPNRVWDNDGEAWVGNYPFSGFRHMHAVHCNPYDGRIWVCIGDLPKRVYTWDGNPASTPTLVTASASETGYTGLTFTTERVYGADDLVGSNQRVWRSTSLSSNSMEVAYSPPARLQVPAYYIRSFGKDELWMSVFNDGNYSGKNHALVRLTKTPGTTQPWTADFVFESETLVPIDIAHDGYGIADEESPFVYVNTYGSDGDLSTGLYRVQRAELPTFDFDLAAAVDAIYDAPPATDSGTGTDAATAPHAIALVPPGADSGAATDDGVPEVVQAAESIVFDLAQRIEALYDIPTLADAGAGTDEGVPVAVDTPVYVVPPGTDGGRGSDVGVPVREGVGPTLTPPAELTTQPVAALRGSRDTATIMGGERYTAAIRPHWPD